MILSFDEAEKIEILRLAQTLSKHSLKSGIENDLNNLTSPEDIDLVYQAHISHLMENTYLFFPKANRMELYKRILLQGIDRDIEVWENVGGRITFKLTDFAFQFVRGRKQMIAILKEYVSQICSTEFGEDVIIRNYRSFNHKKKIMLEYVHLINGYQMDSQKLAEIMQE